MVLQASGFTAVFVFGIVLGNQNYFSFKMRAGEAKRLEEFVTTTAFIMRLLIFILLGAQVDFGLRNGQISGRRNNCGCHLHADCPVTVFLCAWPDRHARWSLNEMLFICWTRETGVIPAALAGLPLGMKPPGAQMIASVTFIAVLMTILIQATTTKWLAGKLNLMGNGSHRDTH
jgi:potassium/hydrogen antiporter